MFARKNPLTQMPVLGLVLLVLFAPDALLQAEELEGEKDLLELSIEELMEVPVVVSASRQEQKITEASVPISIITAEDIHYSGLTSIGEILQFAPGVDMYKFNRYWDVVGVRGLHSLFSDRVQTLINGRLADSTVFGGPTFFTFPAILETASKSPSDAAGKPASITSTPSFSNCVASRIFSAVFMLAPGDCSPSLNVVSKINTLSLMISLHV